MNAKNLSVIVGLGDTGLACARYLQKRNQPFAIMDSRENPPQLNVFLQEFNGITYHVGGFCEKLLDQATEIILSPGVALKEPAIAKQLTNHKSIVGDIELFARDVKKPIVAITGSNGKTTVTTLVGLMVAQAGKKVAVCGNIGEPVLHALDHSAPDYYVVELSSFQLETTYSLQPTAATVLNITPDHMDRYVDLQDYTAAKQRIYHQCHRPVVNNDEPAIWQPLALTQPPIKFALHEIAGCDFYLGEDQQYLMHQGQALIAVNELKLRAQHHLQNALAALSLGHAIDLPMSAMLTVLRDFSGLPHRCQWIRALRGVDYFDDSKGTNVGATEAALISLGKMTAGKIVLIAGGQGKGADFSSLKAPLQKYVSQLILMGEDAPLLEKTFQQVVPITHVNSMQDAVNKAATLAKPGDAVLLSPACASFDMFNNYKHRGEVFVKAVEAL